MKKKLSLLLVLAFVVSMIAGCASTETPASSTANESSQAQEESKDTESTPDPTNEPAAAIPMDTFVVGTPEMNGDFINDFGNNSYDLAIKTLLGGYAGTVYATPDGGLEINETIVADFSTEEDADGNQVATITLHEDLKWNNGETIMAQDYVSALLFRASPEWVEAGATSTLGDSLLGYTEYYAGETTVFSGVKLLGDYQFSLTVSGDKLPYYWETNYYWVDPVHTATYVPGATVMSDDTGSWFEFAEGDLLTSCQNIAATERIAPTVTCGPYSFVSYQNQICTLVINEHFKGDPNGNKPTFTNVIQQAIPQDVDHEWLMSGQVDFVGGVIEGEKIEAIKASDSAQAHSYLRAGYGNLAMHCDFGPTADANVRWALGSLIDRLEVVDYVLGGYGGTVDGAFGMAQWMYEEKKADLQAEMKPISYNVDVANDYLDETEWVFEADGTTAFDRTKAVADGSYIRHNADGEKLIINHLGTTENPVTDIIEIQYTANAPLAGIEFTVTKSDFQALLDNYYDGYQLGEERFYHTFNLATNFTAVDDKYYSWHSDLLGTWQNSCQLGDADLDAYSIEMRNADPSDTETYLNAWFDFQVRWNELLPEIPLYSNEYFDMSHINVDPINTTPYASWYEIICDITKSEK